MYIYFDNAATTKTSKEALSKIIEMSTENFGNPSSSHKFGFLAEKEITNSRKVISDIIGAREDEIYFTSGATEANNLAIIGVAEANKRSGNHIITEKSEHPSVIESCKFLEENGFKITYLENSNNGQIDLDVLENEISSDTILVSLMHVNNETGVIFDIEKIGKIIKRKNKNTLFHVDGVQSFCKFDVDVNKCNIDLFTISGHKLHSPKGVGALYIRKNTKISKRQFGGAQEKKIRSGTENITGITAMAESVKMLYKNRKANMEHVKMLKERLITIQDEIEDTVINGENTSAYILNISFIGVKGEVLMHALEEKNIFVSTGSACHKGAGSQILINYNLDEAISAGGLRISFDYLNTLEEVDTLKKALLEIVPTLRRFKKR